jgi:hypothetical protein
MVKTIQDLQELGWVTVLGCVLILAPLIGYVIWIESLPMEKRGRPVFLATLAILPTLGLLFLFVDVRQS